MGFVGQAVCIAAAATPTPAAPVTADSPNACSRRQLSAAQHCSCRFDAATRRAEQTLHAQTPHSVRRTLELSQASLQQLGLSTSTGDDTRLRAAVTPGNLCRSPPREARPRPPPLTVTAAAALTAACRCRPPPSACRSPTSPTWSTAASPAAAASHPAQTATAGGGRLSCCQRRGRSSQQDHMQPPPGALSACRPARPSPLTPLAAHRKGGGQQQRRHVACGVGQQQRPAQHQVLLLRHVRQDGGQDGRAAAGQGRAAAAARPAGSAAAPASTAPQLGAAGWAARPAACPPAGRGRQREREARQEGARRGRHRRRAHIHVQRRQLQLDHLAMCRRASGQATASASGRAAGRPGA
jgi:hypothetical protein